MDYHPIPAEESNSPMRSLAQPSKYIRSLDRDSSLKTTRLRLGLLVNFKGLVLKDGIERVVR
jgi:hypothetical protein